MTFWQAPFPGLDDPGVTGPVWVPALPPTLETLLAPTLQPVPLIPVLAALMALAYLSGAVRLWAANRRWPLWRTLVFLAGCALIAVTMGAGIEGYGLRMFSVFMFQQLTLMMAAPPLLILGRPGTLLLRATPHKGPGKLLLRLARACAADTRGPNPSRKRWLRLPPPHTGPIQRAGLRPAGVRGPALRLWPDRAAGAGAASCSFPAAPRAPYFIHLPARPA